MRIIYWSSNVCSSDLILNLLVLPLYLVLIWIPPLNLLLFYLLNGYLLGREYFEMVEVRRLDLAAAKRLRRDFRGQVILVGAVIPFLLTLPLVNLVTPIIDRMSVVRGQSVSVRVALDSRRILKKTKQ